MSKYGIDALWLCTLGGLTQFLMCFRHLRPSINTPPTHHHTGLKLVLKKSSQNQCHEIQSSALYKVIRVKATFFAAKTRDTYVVTGSSSGISKYYVLNVQLVSFQNPVTIT